MNQFYHRVPAIECNSDISVVTICALTVKKNFQRGGAETRRPGEVLEILKTFSAPPRLCASALKLTD